MQTVIHSKHGKGEVIKRKVNEKGVYLTVVFENGKEMELGVPASFMNGAIVAQGDLKDEVEKAIAIKKEQMKQETAERLAAMETAESAPVTSARRTGRKPSRKAVVKGSLQNEYEAYLEAAGYPVVGVSGNDSTVPAYSRAVEKVIEREGLTWEGLADNISNIVNKYDTNGVEEDFGARSNRTNINALKRYSEMLDFKKI